MLVPGTTAPERWHSILDLVSAAPVYGNLTNIVSHTPLLLDGRFSGSAVLLSDQAAPRAAVVFVHGFRGDAIETWRDFQGLIQRPDERWWDSKDLYFLEYKYFNEALDFQKQQLMEFVDSIYPRPRPEQLSKSLQDADSSSPSDSTKLRSLWPTSYAELFLVGHSQGCAVIRLLLLDYATLYDSGLSEQLDQYLVMTAANVRLFAPAHLGFRPSKTFKAFLYHFCVQNPRLKWISAALKANVNHEELREGSAKLTELRRRTEGLANKYPAMQGLKAHSVFGQTEEWVVQERFDCDPPYKRIPGQNHVSLCKPRPDFLFPLQFVQYGYKAKATSAGA